MPVRYISEAPPNELMGAKGERRLLNQKRRLSHLNLLISGETGVVVISTVGVELLFKVFRRR